MIVINNVVFVDSLKLLLLLLLLLLNLFIYSIHKHHHDRTNAKTQNVETLKSGII